MHKLICFCLALSSFSPAYAGVIEDDFLIFSAAKCDKKGIESALQKGANVNAVGISEHTGLSALMMTIQRSCSDDVFQFLVDKGSDLNTTYRDETPLSYTSMYSYGNREWADETVIGRYKYLLDHGADLNLSAHGGNSAIHILASTSNKYRPAIVDYLVSRGANISSGRRNFMKLLAGRYSFQQKEEMMTHFIKLATLYKSQGGDLAPKPGDEGIFEAYFSEIPSGENPGNSMRGLKALLDLGYSPEVVYSNGDSEFIQIIARFGREAFFNGPGFAVIPYLKNINYRNASGTTALGLAHAMQLYDLAFEIQKYGGVE